MKKKSFNSLSAPSNIALHTVFILFSLACILPILLILSVSLTDEAALTEYGYHFIPKVFTLSAYEHLFRDSRMLLQAYGMTILVTALGSFINVTIMTLYAYPLSREDFPFKKAFNFYLLLPMLLTGGLVASYMINVTVLNIKNTLWALLLPSLGGGFNIFVMRTYFKENIPSELIDATRIDGAGEFRTFFQIVLPIIIPIIATMLLFNVFAFWNNWQNSLLYVNTPRLYTLQYIMQQALLNLNFMKTNMTNDPNMGEAIKHLPVQSVRMAMVIVGVGPIVLAYPFFQRYFIQGLTQGSVKG